MKILRPIEKSREIEEKERQREKKERYKNIQALEKDEIRYLEPCDAWAILPTNNKSALRGGKTKFFYIVFFIGASATKRWEKSRIFRHT